MDFISLNIEKHVGIITMNRPPVNAFNLKMYNEIIDTFRLVNATKDINIGVLRAEGKQFSTGNDVKDFMDFTPENVIDYANIVSESIQSVYNCRVPLVVAVHGLSLGAGMAIATCGDILIASENAAFGIPEIKVSIVGAYSFLNRILPVHVARFMSLTGELVSAEQMKHFGVVSEIVPTDRLNDASMAMADRLSQLPPLALKGFKEAMKINENAQLGMKYGIEALFIKEMTATEDYKEAINAFINKRTPFYKGK